MAARVPPENHEQQHALQRKFIELRRMTRQVVDLRKHHRPRTGRGAADQLAVDEIAEPAGGEPQRTQRRNEIGDVEPAPPALTRIERERDQHAEKPAVEAHAALPHLKYLEWMNEVIERLVEQDVAQATAENHAEHAVEQHVVDVARM